MVTGRGGDEALGCHDPQRGMGNPHPKKRKDLEGASANEASS